MKKIVYVLLICLFSIGFVSAYIDPGTGGYLVTSFWSIIVTWIAIFGAFVTTYFVKPVARFVKNHKAFVLILILVIAGSFFGGWYLGRDNGSSTTQVISEEKEFDPSISGAHISHEGKMYEGYNLFEGKLMDNGGNVIKKWDSIYLGVIDDGFYYAQEYYESEKFGKYTLDDEVIWEKDIPIHHEIIITPQDTIITFTKEVHEYNGRQVEFGVVLELDQDGNIIQEYSLYDHLQEFQQHHNKLELDKPANSMVKDDSYKNTSIWGGNYDYYHLNHLSIIPENDFEAEHPAFAPGNWLISFRHGSMLFILDKDTKEILWKAIYDQVEDNIEGQHCPIMLENGNILMFDNGRYRGWSRVIELDPVTLDIVWEYKDKDLYSLSQSHVQVLPNGNLLITESEDGRVFEMTRNKEIVWEYYHPDTQNETNSADPEHYGERQWIYKMERYPIDVI